MKKGIGVLGLLALIFFVTSCATPEKAVSTTAITVGSSVAEITAYQGPKAKIAVARFEMKAVQSYGEIGSGMSGMLVDSLFKTNRFIVSERGNGLFDSTEELALSESDYIENGEAAEKGILDDADILLTGEITAFEPNAEGGGVGTGEAYVAVNIRLVDVHTIRTINSTKVEGKASDFKVGVVGGAVWAGGFEKYKNTPMEKAVAVMLDTAIKEIINSVPEDYYRYKSGKSNITDRKL